MTEPRTPWLFRMVAPATYEVGHYDDTGTWVHRQTYPDRDAAADEVSRLKREGIEHHECTCGMHRPGEFCSDERHDDDAHYEARQATMGEP